MRHTGLLLAAVIAGSTIVAPRQMVLAQQSVQVQAADTVFQIETFDRQPGPDGIAHSHGFGTAFFIAADGTALTASHVVYLAAHNPEKYKLQALVGKEFYDANVVCSSRLPYDPSKPDTVKQGVPYGRDVAQIKLAPSTNPEGHRQIFYRTKDGTRIPLAEAHLGPLPEFPFLTIGKNRGQHVHIVGYGAISAIPTRWTAEGQVERVWNTRDGTEVFDVTSTNPAMPGDSGAPVLNDAGEVVGIWAWHYYNRPDTGTAQDMSGLMPACR